MDFGKLGQEFSQLLLNITGDLLSPTEGPASLSEMEHQLRVKLLEAGQFIMTAWLGTRAETYPADTQTCPYCEAEANYKFKRPGKLYTLFGEISYNRAYYLCPSCQQGFYPLDQQYGLRPGQMSAEIERLSGMVGVQMPFGQGSDLFEALTLVSLSDHSVAKATQTIGAEVARQEAEWLDQSQDEDWLQEQDRQAERPERLYGAIDAAKVHIRGEKEHPWRDLKVGCWFTTTQEPPRQPNEDWSIQAEDISYYCDIQPAQEFGQLVWATGCQHKAQLAQELVFLGDGARWIWDLVSEHYPEATQIVDWFHASEYIAPVAQAVFGDTPQGEQWLEQVRSDLWNGKLTAVIQAFERFADHPSAKDAARKAVTYFTNNRHRMDYPTYRAQGYQIGSGTIESGCKQIVSQRLKVAGAIWTKDSAIHTAKARAALLSDQWDDITSRREFLALPLAV